MTKIKEDEKKDAVEKAPKKKVVSKKDAVSIPEHMIADGTGNTKLEKHENGWYRIHKNGTKELIHCT